ncbi:MAG: hypothetical protein NTY48_05595 [Candidatus Diapherotrites archaeon]|nr:hypothetical protein [Candidatus Diapherotrites archaeon]
MQFGFKDKKILGASVLIWFISFITFQFVIKYSLPEPAYAIVYANLFFSSAAKTTNPLIIASIVMGVVIAIVTFLILRKDPTQKPLDKALKSSAKIAFISTILTLAYNVLILIAYQIWKNSFSGFFAILTQNFNSSGSSYVISFLLFGIVIQFGYFIILAMIFSVVGFLIYYTITPKKAIVQ